MTRIRLGLASVTSPLEVGADQAPALLSALERGLTGLRLRDLELVPAPGPVSDPSSAAAAGRLFYDKRVDAVCVIAASWYEDYAVVDMLEECPVPVIAWARPGMEAGSLCGMQQLGYMLKQLDHPYVFVFDAPDSAHSLRLAYEYAQSAALMHQLRRARIGYLGHRVEGMTETTGHELALKKRLGPRVVGIDSQQFLDASGRVAPMLVEDHWHEIVSKVGRISATEEAGLVSLQVYTALKRTMSESGLDAVAVGCYPHLMGKVCLAASLLGEEGLPIACEGDINGALGMLILTRLSGQPVHNTDMLDPIPEDNAIVFSHCGSGGMSLAPSPEQIELAPVRLQHRGLCCLFPARPGPVTLLNIVPTMDGYRLAAAFGQALETDMVFPGNPLKVDFGVAYRDVLEWVAREGLGHHWMAAYGDYRTQIEHLCRLTDCDYVSLA